MKIAVTGANGFVGKALCQQLLADGYQVTAMTRQSWNFPNVTNWVISDYSHPSVINGLKGHDCILHLAAKTHSGTKATSKNLASYRSINLEPSITLAHAAILANVTRFIYLSSIKVNGEQTYSKPFCHTDIPAPEDAYGISKWEAEKALCTLLAGTTTELVVVRPPLIWSPQETKGNLQLLNNWVKSGIPLPLKNWNNKRDLISLDNLCNFLSLCTKHSQVAGQTFLVSDGQPLNSLEIAALVSKKLPNSVGLPQGLYKILSHSKLFRKLYGDLEVDINHTFSVTSWKPTKTY